MRNHDPLNGPIKDGKADFVKKKFSAQKHNHIQEFVVKHH